MQKCSQAKPQPIAPKRRQGGEANGGSPQYGQKSQLLVGADQYAGCLGAATS